MLPLSYIHIHRDWNHTTLVYLLTLFPSFLYSEFSTANGLNKGNWEDSLILRVFCMKTMNLEGVFNPAAVWGLGSDLRKDSGAGFHLFWRSRHNIRCLMKVMPSSVSVPAGVYSRNLLTVQWIMQIFRDHAGHGSVGLFFYFFFCFWPHAE